MIDNPDIGVPAPAWKRLRFEATAAAAEEPSLSSYLSAAILTHTTLGQALSYHLAEKLSNLVVGTQQVRHVISGAYESERNLVSLAEADLQAVLERDPACRGVLQPFLFFKGFLALQTHRIAHELWRQGRETLAFHFQSRASELFDVDIHPAARIGGGVMLDHASGITIGETAVVGEGCSLLHGVTLGGTGKEVGDRHPKIGRGVLLSVGAKILGNITIGDEAKVAAGSVVLKDVPAHCTVAGVPAKVVGGPSCCQPAKTMDQGIPDQTGI
ncbi:MAG: serine O-acetyltransferase [Hyphomonas sp.]|uniref:serine O-acetyltransferase n=1 Tax=Hyphomonas sp. TaxID=87 RepID=UPI0017D7ADBB|nr:serine O-acetyltransferase [Hyphomonas sp.]MBA3069755.1 serine O-acetyltransferase [Hyphomonas sp.]MBU3921056.1 serine O-acetyltransferase [Alphaproteobacteria bacterium]MBU4062596.1 serine O-acetyltransferase [Alphaproteobacteria bacterium]MBU4163947.1 serine O-acetyltransferase [Alphaproteobacteria bacterium]